MCLQIKSADNRVLQEQLNSKVHVYLYGYLLFYSLSRRCCSYHVLYADTVPHFFPVLRKQRIARKGEVARAATSNRYYWYIVSAC